MSGEYYSVINGEVQQFDSAEERDMFDDLHPTCVFVKDNKNPYQDYWFCHCSECGYKTNTILTEGNEERPGWNFCPSCGTEVRR